VDWWPQKRSAIARREPSLALCGMLFSTIFFLKLLFFFEFADFFFQDTYNTWLKERYGDDTLTHPDLDPDLWLEAWLFGGPYRNWLYSLSNTTTEDLRTTHNVSTIRCL
jgi:hypothetical protein